MSELTCNPPPPTAKPLEFVRSIIDSDSIQISAEFPKLSYTGYCNMVATSAYFWRLYGMSEALSVLIDCKPYFDNSQLGLGITFWSDHFWLCFSYSRDSSGLSMLEERAGLHLDPARVHLLSMFETILAMTVSQRRDHLFSIHEIMKMFDRFITTPAGRPYLEAFLRFPAPVAESTKYSIVHHGLEPQCNTKLAIEGCSVQELLQLPWRLSQLFPDVVTEIESEFPAA